MIVADVIKSILERFYALDEEYDFLCANIGYKKFCTEEHDEYFWGVVLSDDRFMLCNTPLDFWGGPRSLIGMVGVHKDFVMQRKASADLFMSVGQTPIDYYHRNKKKPNASSEVQ